MENVSYGVQFEFEKLIKAAYRISADVGQQVEQALQEGSDNPINEGQARRLLTKVITTLKRQAELSGDTSTSNALSGDIGDLVEQIVKSRNQFKGNERKGENETTNQDGKIELVEWNGIAPGPERPTPCFHHKEIPMRLGYVKTTDIKLWDSNDRLELYLAQFKQSYGKQPSHDDLLDIMRQKITMHGTPDVDEFKISKLAASIAVNGVRVPPIIDINGNLIDGNRRVAACYEILLSEKYDSKAKQRVEYIYVRQLTEFASPNDQDAVIVSLNFEEDFKEKWPKYVRARKVYDAWQAMLDAEPRKAGPSRQKQIKQELARKFALSTNDISLFIRMVKWAKDFEEYHINEKGRDEHEVRYRANDHIEYFDELSKGPTSGVAAALDQDEPFKHLVFDLLFQKKFKNFTLIRKLKLYDESMREALQHAIEEPNLEEAQDQVERILVDAKDRTRESRVVGANPRIENFVEWLLNQPPNVFSKEIRPENLQRLMDALEYVQEVSEILKKKPTL